MRAGWRWLLLVAFAGVAFAQSAPQTIGTLEQGSVQTSELLAENASCSQPLDFRFTFQTNSWLRPQSSSEVIGVVRGQSVSLPVVIDATHLPPGQHVTQVEVECLNCGVWVFRNCRFDRQQLVLAINVTPPPQPQPQPLPQTEQPATPISASETTAPPLDSASMADLTGPQRAALEGARDRAARAAAAAAAADEALDEASRRRRRCEDELSAQALAAAQLQSAAEAAAAQAADAAAQADANQAALSAAQGAIAHREEAVQIQINYLNLILPQDGPNSQRVQNAQQYIRDAQAALAAAQQAIADAQAALAASQAAAAQAAADAAAAQAAAAAAAAALSEKERECLGLGEAEAGAAAAAQQAGDDSAGASRDRDQAERDAAAQAAQNLQEEIDRCRERCEDCHRQLARLVRAQLQAMEALAQLGLLNPTQHVQAEQVTLMDQVLEALGPVGEAIATDVLPALATSGGAGVPDVGADTMLGALQAGYGIMAIRQDMMAPFGSTAGSAHVTDAERIQNLMQNGFAGSPQEAQEVLNEMSNFMSNGRSTSNMSARLGRLQAECAQCEADLAALQARQAGQ